jgi:hypothetical protein
LVTHADGGGGGGGGRRIPVVFAAAFVAAFFAYFFAGFFAAFFDVLFLVAISETPFEVYAPREDSQREVRSVK